MKAHNNDSLHALPQLATHHYNLTEYHIYLIIFYTRTIFLWSQNMLIILFDYINVVHLYIAL